MKKLLTTILLTLTILQANLATPAITFATPSPSFVPVSTVKPDLLPGPNNVTTENARELTDQIIPKFTVRLIGLIGGLALIFLVIAGLRYVVSYTNEEAHAKAKEQIIYTIVGLLVALLAYTIVSIIVNIDFKPKP